MSLDDYLIDAVIKNKKDLKEFLIKYHKKESVYVFNTYDFFDYIVFTIEAKNNMTCLKVLEKINKLKDDFCEVVESISEDTYFEFNIKLFDRLLKDYLMIKNKEGKSLKLAA